MNKNQTAVVIFALDVREELQKKQFFGADRGQSEHLLHGLNQQIRSTVKSTGLPYFIIDSEKQEGKTFVNRYKNAIQSVFDQGFEHVIAVGNDSPELDKNTILTVANCINAGYNVVYGGTDRGGIYTLGLSRAAFQAFQFEKMSWQSDQLLSEFEAYRKLNSDTCYSLKTTLAELNTNRDVSRFIKQISGNLKSRILFGKLFRKGINPRVVVPLVLEVIFLFNLIKIKLRGPPNFQFI